MSVDWSGCPAVERVADRVSGRWVVKGTRIPVDGVLRNAEDGFTAERLAAEVYEGLSVTAARAILSFAQRGFVCRILLDQNAPLGLRDLFPGHEVRTACQMGWQALANGELLSKAEAAGFEALITCDEDIRTPRNVPRRKIALLVLGTPSWSILRDNTAPILRSLDQIGEGSFHLVAFPPARTEPGAASTLSGSESPEHPSSEQPGADGGTRLCEVPSSGAHARL